MCIRVYIKRDVGNNHQPASVLRRGVPFLLSCFSVRRGANICVYVYEHICVNRSTGQTHTHTAHDECVYIERELTCFCLASRCSFSFSAASLLAAECVAGLYIYINVSISRSIYVYLCVYTCLYMCVCMERASQYLPTRLSPASCVSCLCVFCVGPLCGPPLRLWVLCGALPSVWVPCVFLCGSPVWVPCGGPLCVGPLCGSPVWVPRRAASMCHLLA